MIEIRGRKYRNLDHLYAEYEKAQQENQVPEAAETEQEPPETDGERVLRERVEAHQQAHAPTEKKAYESGVRLVGEKTMRDWKRWHDQ